MLKGKVAPFINTKMKLLVAFLLGTTILLAQSCKQKTVTVSYAVMPAPTDKVALCCESHIPKRFASLTSPAALAAVEPGQNDRKGMIWIKAGAFMMGGDNSQASPDELPKHKVTVDGFWMDATEVTNAQFARFVLATGYITHRRACPDLIGTN